MFSNRLLALALILLAAHSAHAAETWETASTRLQAHVDAKRGTGAIVLLERLDHQTVRVRVKALWPSFRGASIQSSGEAGTKQLTCQVEGGAGDTLVHTAIIDHRATRMEVRLHGSDFNPKIMLKLPALGQAEVGTVLMGRPGTGI
jgi:hypothetical protein